MATGIDFSVRQIRISKITANGVDITSQLEQVDKLVIPHTSKTGASPSSTLTYNITGKAEYTDYFIFDITLPYANTSGSNETGKGVVLEPYTSIRVDNSDYNALFNNTTGISNSANVQKVDYSTNPFVPINIQAIRRNLAEKAEVQEYLYNSVGMVSGRYIGKQLSAVAINEYSSGDKSYGKSPVIEHKIPYFCVFDYISGFSPEHNQANAIVVSYIVDEAGNILTPDAPEALPLLQQGFPADSDVSISIQNASIGGSEATLLGEHTILRGGSRIEPIIYSYTATTYLSPVYSTSANLTFSVPNPQPTTYDFNAYSSSPQSLGPNANDKTVLTFGTETKDDQNYFASNVFSLGEDTEQRIQFTFTGTFNATGYYQPGGYTTGRAAITIEHCTDSTFAPSKTTVAAYTIINYNDYVNQEITVNTPLKLYNSGSSFRIVADVDTPFDSFDVYDRVFTGKSEFSGSAYMGVTGSFTTGSFPATTLTGSSFLSGKYGAYFEGISGSSSDGFNTVTLPFEIYPGDEIKFNNDEFRTYLVTEVQTPSQNSQNKLYITLDKPLRKSDNINFYAVRRYVDASNMVLMNIEKVAGTQNRGILYPKYPSRLLEQNYKKILSTLKDKGIL